jgi:hypothetical protein
MWMIESGAYFVRIERDEELDDGRTDWLIKAARILLPALYSLYTCVRSNR